MNVGVSPKFTIEALPHPCPGVMGRGPVVSCGWDPVPMGSVPLIQRLHTKERSREHTERWQQLWKPRQEASE